MIENREVHAYLFLVSLIICGLAASLITAPKIIHAGINFPFSNIVFSILTYPIVDCICEIWGKRAARQALYFGLMSQTLIAIIIQLSIMTPHASFWDKQIAYQTILSSGVSVITASLLAFGISQILDIAIYQKIKELSKGKHLWLRSNTATWLGQAIDSVIFINIIFFDSDQKINIIFGSILVKVILSFLMTPVVYLIIFIVNKYLNSKAIIFTPTISPAN